jgi:hypothetical protein
LPINIDLPIVFIDNNEEILMSTSYNANNKNQLNMSEINEVETIDLSEVINQATTSMKEINNQQID